MQKQIVPISFNQGIDTKTDKKQVIGKLLVLKNAFFQTLNEFRKRFGFTELSTTPLTQGNALATFQDELLSFTGKTVNSYSEEDDLWYEKGQKIAVSLEVNSIVKNSYNQSLADSAINNGYQLFAYEDSRGGIRYTVRDIETGLLVVSDVLISSTGFKPKVKNLGIYFVILYGDTSDNFLKIRTIDTNTPDVISSASTFASDIMGSNPNYDICLLNGSLYVGYNATTGLGFYSLSTSLVKSSQYLIPTEDAGFAISVFSDIALDQIWVVYCNFTQEIKYLIINDTLTAQILTPNTISAEASAALRISGFADNGDGEIYVEYLDRYSNLLKKATLDNSGISSQLDIFLYAAGLAGKPFLMNEDHYFLIAHGNILGSGDSPFYEISPQPTYFLINTSGSVVGKLAPGVGGGVISQGESVFKNTVPEATVSGLEVSYPYLIKYAVTADNGDLKSQKGVSDSRFIFNRPMVTKDVSRNLLISGALISMYDGTNVVENGFNLYPEKPRLTQMSGGAMSDGQYQYQTTFEWTDNQGQIHLSAPSLPEEIDVSAVNLVRNFSTSSGFPGITSSTNLRDIYYGSVITGNGIPGNTFVKELYPLTNIVLMSDNATASAGTESLTFSPNIIIDEMTIFNNSDVALSEGIASLYKTGVLIDNHILYVDDVTLGYIKKGMTIIDAWGTLSGVVTDVSNNKVILNSSVIEGEFLNSLFLISNNIQNITITNGSPDFDVPTNDLPRIKQGDKIEADGVVRTVLFIVGNTVTVDSPMGVSGLTSVDVFFNKIAYVYPGHKFTSSYYTGEVTVLGVNRVTNTMSLDKKASQSTVDQQFLITNTSSVLVSDYNLYLTDKVDVRNVVYRTEANGTILYRTSSLQNPLINIKDSSEWGMIDTTSDTILVGNNLIYTTGGVIENIAPPASDIFGSFKNRVILVPSENTLTWQFSQQAIPGIPIQFNDVFVKNIDQTGGGISAIGTIDEKLIFFKDSHIFFTVGDGPTSTGANDDFIEAQLITTDSGCTNRKSVARMPLGLMYRSEKGIYLLDRSLAASYLGQNVAGYNDIEITSAQLEATLNQVRFTLVSGETLVYDYLVNQWSVFTNINAADAVIFDNRFTYARPSGPVYKEDPTNYTDDGDFIQMYLETAWLQFAGIQGFERIYKLLLIGEYESPHTLNVITRTDFKDDDNQNVIIPVLSDPGVYQYRVFTKIQKCESMKIIIYDTQGSPFGQGMRLSAMTLEVGIKQGTNKLSAAKSYG